MRTSTKILAASMSLGFAILVLGLVASVQARSAGFMPEDVVWSDPQPNPDGWESDREIVCSVQAAVTLSASSEPRVRYKIGGTWSLWIAASIMEVPGGVRLTAPGIEFPEGSDNRVQFRVRNVNAVETSPEYPVQVDRTPPTIDVTAPSTTTLSQFRVAWVARDELSGLGNTPAIDVDYRVNESEWTSWLQDLNQSAGEREFGPTEPITVTAVTTYSFRVSTEDQAGVLGVSQPFTTHVVIGLYLPMINHVPSPTPTTTPTSTATPTSTPTSTPTPIPTPSWQRVALPGQRTRDVAERAGSSAVIYAASEVSGSHRSSTCGSGTWAPLGPANKFALSVLPLGNLDFVGTFLDGLWRREGGGSWTKINVGNPYIWTLVARTGTEIYAGTDSGVFRSTDAGLTWQSWSQGLSGSALLIDHLLVDQQGTLWAATYGGGVYSSQAGVNSWTPRNNGLQGNALRAWKLIQVSGSVIVGTSAGVFHYDVGAWQSIGMTNKVVYALAADTAGTLYAGTKDSGVYARLSGAQAWSPINTGWSSTMEVRDLLVAPSCNALFAASQDGIWRYPTP